MFFGNYVFKDRFNDSFNCCIYYVLRQVGNWCIGIYIIGIQFFVIIIGMFVILSCWYDVEFIVISEGEKGEFFII